MRQYTPLCRYCGDEKRFHELGKGKCVQCDCQEYVPYDSSQRPEPRSEPTQITRGVEQFGPFKPLKKQSAFHPAREAVTRTEAGQPFIKYKGHDSIFKPSQLEQLKSMLQRGKPWEEIQNYSKEYFKILIGGAFYHNYAPNVKVIKAVIHAKSEKMSRTNKVTETEKADIIEQYRKLGNSGAVAEKVHRSSSVVYKILKESGAIKNKAVPNDPDYVITKRFCKYCGQEIK